MASLIHTLAVAEYLNFRHAASALGVAQSSVSARVKALEEDLGKARAMRQRMRMVARQVAMNPDDGVEL